MHAELNACIRKWLGASLRICMSCVLRVSAHGPRPLGPMGPIFNTFSNNVQPFPKQVFCIILPIVLPIELP